MDSQNSILYKSIGERRMKRLGKTFYCCEDCGKPITKTRNGKKIRCYKCSVIHNGIEMAKKMWKK